jgi:ATP-grasp domain, R2K clade family 3
MFAPDRDAAERLVAELSAHQLAVQQGLLVRRFVPLETFETTASGLPITNEWRFFFLRGESVGHGYYWATLASDPTRARIDAEGIAFADRCGRLAAPHIPFVVADVARTQSGEWILIELNDAQTSGLGTLDPDVFYQRLRSMLG